MESERQAAIRNCRHCDGDGWRIDPDRTHLGPIRPLARCDHTQPHHWPPDDGAAIDDIRALALTIPCDDPEHGCGAYIAEFCTRPDGTPLDGRQAAHHTRVRHAQANAALAETGATP